MVKLKISLLRIGCFFTILCSFDESATQPGKLQLSNDISAIPGISQSDIKEESAKDTIAKNIIRLGEYYSASGLYTQAIDQYKKALNLINKKPVSILTVDLYNNIGNVYISMNNYDSAKLFYKESLEKAIKINYIRGKAIAQGYLGTTYEKKGDYLQALEYQKKSLAIFTSLRDSTGIAMINENIGSIYEDLQKYELAYNYFTSAYDILKGTNTKEEANVLNNIGDTHRKSGDLKKALFYTQKSLNISLLINDNSLIKSGFKDLSKTYALFNDYETAYEHRSEADKYHQKALENQSLHQINALQAAFEAEKREAQIQLLQEQNKVSKTNLILLFVVSTSAIFTFLVLLIYYNKKRKARQKILNYKQRTLKAELEKKEIEEQNLQRDIQLRTTALSRYSLHLSQKNKILSELSNTLKYISSRKNIDYNKKIKEIAKEIDFNLKQENEWEEFKVFFKDIHPDFLKKLSGISQETLSPSELKLGILLRLNLSSKEIASILRVTPDSVRVARYRLRKKLPIDPKEDLVNFMLTI